MPGRLQPEQRPVSLRRRTVQVPARDFRAPVPVVLCEATQPAAAADTVGGYRIGERLGVDVPMGDAVDHHLVEIPHPPVHGSTQHRRNRISDPQRQQDSLRTDPAQVISSAQSTSTPNQPLNC